MKTDLLLHEETLAAVDRYVSKTTQAVLYTGAAGTGKATLARQVSAWLLHTTATKLDNTPGFICIAPKDGVIRIEDVRRIVHFVQLVVPGRAAVARVICIEDADTMTREAQNALLKLLEEPPERTVFMLTSSRLRQLLPTVLSRLQKLHVRLPEASKIIDLYEKNGFEKAEVERAFMRCAGSIARLNSLLHEPSDEIDVTALAKQVLASDVFGRLTMIDTTIKDKEVASEVVRMLVVIASASMRSASGRQSEQWHKILSAAHRAEMNLLKKGNQKLVLTELMLAI